MDIDTLRNMLQSGYGIGPLKKNAVPSKFLPGEPILVESNCDMNLGHNVDIGPEYLFFFLLSFPQNERIFEW